MRLGTFIERADSTARILDSKFDFNSAEFTGKTSAGVGNDQRVDYYYWASILRAVSAFDVYRRVYRDVVSSRRVAELLIQRPDMPRSLLACLNEVCVNLAAVGDPRNESHRLAGRLRADLQFLRIDAEFEQEIHGFLQRFLEQIYYLGICISSEYLGHTRQTSAA